MYLAVCAKCTRYVVICMTVHVSHLWVWTCTHLCVISLCCLIFYVQLFSFIAQCPELPSIPNGAITYFPDFIPDYDDSTVATYRCNPGFFLVGIPTRTCSISMTWAGQPPVCQRKIRFYIIGSGDTKLSICKLACILSCVKSIIVCHCMCMLCILCVCEHAHTSCV